MSPSFLPAGTKRAFSLVEMLVVIAVIGILAAIAVPNVGNVNHAANESKNRRNAQNLASVSQAAQAAGKNFVSGSDVSATIANIVAGATITDTSSPFYDTYFGVPNLSTSEQDKAADYLGLENGMLVYYEEGAASGGGGSSGDPIADSGDSQPDPEPEPEAEPESEPEPEQTWGPWTDFQYISNGQVGGRIAQLQVQMPEKEWRWTPTSNGSYSMIQFRQLQ